MKEPRNLLLAPLVIGSLAALAADPPPPPPLWSGKAESSFISTSGNTSTQTFGLGAEGAYRPAPWTIEAKLAFVRSEADGVENAKSLAFSLKGARNLTPRLDLYVLGGYLKNTFSGIDSRYAGEVGVGYMVVPPAPHALKVEAGLGYTKETRLLGEDRSFATARGALLYKWTISKTTELSEEASFTESLKDSGDWRFANVSSVSASITSVFALKISHQLNYLNQPVPGFRKTDTITSAALVAKF